MPKYSEQQAREAIAASRSWAETLRRLGLRAAGGNFALLQRWAPRQWRQRFCSVRCWTSSEEHRELALAASRKVPRPSHAHLLPTSRS